MASFLSCIPLPLKDWSYTILLGALVTTYWRGTWVLLDIWTCDQPHTASLVGGDSFCFLVPAMEDMPDGYYWELRKRSARISYGIGLALLFLGVTMLWSGMWLPKLEVLQGMQIRGDVTPSRAIVRFLIIYILGFSACCLWRGIWYWADAWILPENPLGSYWTTSLVGSTTAFLCGAGASLLAPPAIFLLDGPGENPPPIGVTVASSYYSLTLPYNEKPPALPLFVRIADVVGSFVFLPFAVVWFWRGTWMLLDHYFWGFTLEPKDVWHSKLWGFIFAIICFAITCEPAFGRLDRLVSNRHVLGLLGRLRTWILAWGTVSFWRVAWYVWDEFLGGTSSASAWASHVISLVCLTCLGCVSSINAPASTLGVDAVPHKECADEPLFAMIPIPYELVYVFAIGRKESARTEMKDKEKADRDVKEKTYRDIELTTSSAKGAGAEEKLDDDEEPLVERAMEEGDDEKMETDDGEKEAPPPSEEEPADRKSSTTSWFLGHSRGVIHGSLIRSSLIRGSVLRTDQDGNRVSYCELQRPQLGSRTQSESCIQRPTDGNPRRRSNFHRSR